MSIIYEVPFGESHSLIDHFGVRQYLAPNGELVALPLYRLAGDQFGGDILDAAVWTATLGATGTATTNTGELVLSTGAGANSSTSVVSTRIARFAGLQPNKIRIPATLPDLGRAGNIRRWGAFDDNNGPFFVRNGTQFALGRRKGTVDTLIASGAFNGQYGPFFDPGTDFHFYEILWQPRQIQWYADNRIIHTFTAGATPWTLSFNFPIRIDNVNSGGLAANLAINVRLATITRFGIPEMENLTDFQQGMTAAKILKHDGGRLKGVIISAVTNNSVVTFYDNIVAAGRVIWSSGAMPANTTPFPLPMGDAPFNLGLTLAITTANADVYTAYD